MADERESTLCWRCGERWSGRMHPSFAGMRALRCETCDRATLLPMSVGWRGFWWCVAALTTVAVVIANATLRDGWSWIPAGFGILSIVALGIDISMRRRVAHAHQDAVRAVVNSDAPRANVVVGDVQREPSPRAAVALTTLAVVSAVASIVGVLVVVGLNNGYTHDVVVTPRVPATSQLVHTSTLQIEDEGEAICGDGEDFAMCVDLHTGMYNTVCVGTDLTPSSGLTCSSLRSWLDEAYAQVPCGGCTTRAGWDGWGWNYLRLTPSRATVTVPSSAEVTYEARCDFDLGAIRLGDCPGRPEAD